MTGLASSGFVRTVLGDLSPDTLGWINTHEHFFQVSPLLPGDELNDFARSAQEARQVHAAGIATLVDATPYGLGRRPIDVQRIAATTGLHVVATTGFHRPAHYRDQPELLQWSIDKMTAQIRRELLEGMTQDHTGPGEPTESRSLTGMLTAFPRAGVVKAGINYWEIPEFSRRVLNAVAEAHRGTGAPVMVHLEHGSAAHEVLDFLESRGVSPTRVLLAHIDRNPDPLLYTELAQRGAYLGCDGAARVKDWPESLLIDAMVRAAESEQVRDRIVLGGDVARATRYRSYGGIPGMAYLTERFVPRFERVAGPELVDRVLRRNPARWLTWAMETE